MKCIIVPASFIIWNINCLRYPTGFESGLYLYQAGVTGRDGIDYLYVVEVFTHYPGRIEAKESK
jgi:hypothetical protein